MSDEIDDLAGRRRLKVTAQILADHGDEVGDYVYHAMQAASDDHEAVRRWLPVIDKMVELSGQSGCCNDAAGAPAPALSRPHRRRGPYLC
jgi:hypothetical protein